MTDRRPRALRSFRDVNLSIGAMLAGLEQKILHSRPPAIIVAAEEARAEQLTLDGLLFDHLPTEALDRPEPPDRSGARL